MQTLVDTRFTIPQRVEGRYGALVQESAVICQLHSYMAEERDSENVRIFLYLSEVLQSQYSMLDC